MQQIALSFFFRPDVPRGARVRRKMKVFVIKREVHGNFEFEYWEGPAQNGSGLLNKPAPDKRRIPQDAGFIPK
jgi:hypothetical protein